MLKRIPSQYNIQEINKPHVLTLYLIFFGMLISNASNFLLVIIVLLIATVHFNTWVFQATARCMFIVGEIGVGWDRRTVGTGGRLGQEDGWDRAL